MCCGEGHTVNLQADANSFFGVLSVRWDDVLKALYTCLDKADIKFTIGYLKVIPTHHVNGYGPASVKSNINLETNVINAINEKLFEIFDGAGIERLDLTHFPFDIAKDAIPQCAACCCSGNGGVPGMCCPC